MEMIYDQQFFIFSYRERCRAHSAHRMELWRPTQDLHRPQPCLENCLLLIKDQPGVTAETIYLIKMGYSGVILQYVNEGHIRDIY
jgi:hypothetical protein